MRLAGRITIVAGAGPGFGEGIANIFAREGARAVVNDLDAEAGERVTNAIRVAGGDAHFVQVDVSNDDSAAKLLGAMLVCYDDLHIVVNNIGTAHKNKPLLQITENEFDCVMAVNVKSIYWTAHHIVSCFRERGGGVFVNVASTAGVRPRSGLVWCNVSKGAVITASKAMAAELGPDKIRASCVNPVMGATGLIEQFVDVSDTPENRARFLTTIPMGRLSTPQDMANACLYLASDRAEFITGACLEVDGGRRV